MFLRIKENSFNFSVYRNFYATHNTKIKFLICVVVGLLINTLLRPVAIDLKTWTLFSIFVSVILGVILRPFPMGAVALIGLSVAILTKTLDMQKEALIGFSSPIVWLVVMVFFLSRGMIKTHLGMRIAYYFVRLLGKNTLSLGYGIALAEFFIAPAIPSNTARAGGVMMPITKAICENLGSTPNDGTEGKLGSYLMKIGFQANTICSAIFLTACAVNPVAQAFASDEGIIISWMSWFYAAIVPGLISLLVMPLFLYIIYPPGQKHLENAKSFAQSKLDELGPMSKKEISMASIFILMIVLWILEPYIKINATTVAFLGISLCMMTDILNLQDILNEKEAWHTLIWLSILITFSMFLQKWGLTSWFAQSMGGMVTGYNPISTLIILVLIYYYSHYFFAGNSPHVTAMYPAFLSVALAAGAPPMLSALMIGFMGSLFSATTHYGAAAGALYYGTRYVPVTAWWVLGFLLSLVYLAIWLGIGMYWWHFIGVY